MGLPFTHKRAYTHTSLDSTSITPGQLPYTPPYIQTTPSKSLPVHPTRVHLRPTTLTDHTTQGTSRGRGRYDTRRIRIVVAHDRAPTPTTHPYLSTPVTAQLQYVPHSRRRPVSTYLNRDLFVTQTPTESLQVLFPKSLSPEYGPKIGDGVKDVDTLPLLFWDPSTLRISSDVFIVRGSWTGPRPGVVVVRLQRSHGTLASRRGDPGLRVRKYPANASETTHRGGL